MSEQEKKLLRLQAWDDYQVAREAFLAHQDKIKSLSKALTAAAEKLSVHPLSERDRSALNIPNAEALPRCA